MTRMDLASTLRVAVGLDAVELVGLQVTADPLEPAQKTKYSVCSFVDAAVLDFIDPFRAPALEMIPKRSPTNPIAGSNWVEP